MSCDALQIPGPARRRTVSCSVRPASRASLTPVITSSSPFATSSVKRTEAFGAFTPTSSAFSSLLCMATPSSTIASFSKRVVRKRVQSIFHIPSSDTENEESDSGPPSPASSVPSFSRTSSYDHTVPSITSPACSSSATLFDDANPSIKPIHKIELDPILAALEKKSKFCTFKAKCATCGKQGSDFPRCGRCGELWCSRECRLRGGKKHVCRKS